MLPLDLAGIAIGATVLAGAVWMRRAFRRARFQDFEWLRRWGRAGKVLALEERWLGGPTRLEGHVEGVEVRLTILPTGTAEAEVRGAWPKEIEVSPQTIGQALRGRAVESGDTEFDAVVSLHGPPVVTIALLSTRVRRVLLALARSGGRIEDGAVRITLASATPGRALDDVRWLVSVAKVLQQRNGIAVESRLLEMLRVERRGSVRAAVVRAAASAPRTPELERVLRAALEDLDDEVRRVAGVALGLDAPGHLSIAEADRRGSLSPAPAARDREPRGTR